jgi:hypothetical protein
MSKENKKNKGNSKSEKVKVDKTNLEERMQTQIDRWKTKYEDSEQEKQELLDQVEFNMGAMKFHLEQVKINTGEILADDVSYCKKLMTRIIDFKFKK